MLSRRLDKINDSPTLALTVKVNQLRKSGVNIIGFGAGEPDFPTPKPIVEAAIKALRDGYTRYTASNGIPELRHSIAAKFRRDNHLHYDPNSIVVSNGAKHSLFNALMVLCNKGDEVIIQAPYWVSYPYMIRLTGAKPVIVNTSEAENFKLTPERLQDAITPKTKVFLLNSPNNPTGVTYSRSELIALGNVCLQHGIYIISDEIYEKLIYEGRHYSIAALDKRFREITVTVNGVSKVYCMTGWRMGYSGSPPRIADAIKRIQDHSTSCITSFVQKASIVALELGDGVVTDMKAEFNRRRKRMVELLNDIPGIKCYTPSGAFYAFANIEGLFGKVIDGKRVANCMSLAEIALEAAKVAVVPGSAFGVTGFLRLSYATSMQNIEEGLSRLKKMIVEA